MVLLGLLRLAKPVTVDELAEHLKVRQTDLKRELSGLCHDGLIGCDECSDLTDVEDPAALTSTQRKEYQKEFFLLDFKCFLDSAGLNILSVQRLLNEGCGREKRTFYECPTCKTNCSPKYVRELLDHDTDDGVLRCRDCPGEVERVRTSPSSTRTRSGASSRRSRARCSGSSRGPGGSSSSTTATSGAAWET